MGKALLSIHDAFAYASAASAFRPLQLPAIPEIALDIRAVHVSVSDVANSGVPLADAIWVITHNTGAPDIASAASPTFWDTPGSWLRGALSNETNYIKEFASGEMPVAGEQLFGLSNGSGITLRVMVQIFFEQRRVSLLDWTLLKSRTSFEED